MISRILSSVVIFSLLSIDTILPSLDLQKAIAQTSQESSKTSPSIKPISAEKRALIKELLEITEAPRNLNETIDANIRTTLSELISTVLKKAPDLGSGRPGMEEKLMDIVSKMSTKYRDRVFKEIDANQLIEQVAFPIYDKYFTEAEMQDIVGFYKSATGKKALSLTPKIFGDSIARTYEILMPKMSKIMNEVITEELPNVLPKKK